MTTEIKQRWFLPKYNLSITPDGTVLTSSLTPCSEEIYQGKLVFRIPGTSVRISRKYINKHCIIHEKIIQQHLPF
jgi:hypothetical protein